MDFIISNQEIFQTNSCIHNINTISNIFIDQTPTYLVSKKDVLCWHTKSHPVWQSSRMKRLNLEQPTENTHTHIVFTVQRNFLCVQMIY